MMRHGPGVGAASAGDDSCLAWLVIRYLRAETAQRADYIALPAGFALRFILQLLTATAIAAPALLVAAVAQSVGTYVLAAAGAKALVRAELGERHAAFLGSGAKTARVYFSAACRRSRCGGIALPCSLRHQ